MKAKSNLINPIIHSSNIITKIIFENRFIYISELIQIESYNKIERNSIIYRDIKTSYLSISNGNRFAFFNKSSFSCLYRQLKKIVLYE